MCPKFAQSFWARPRILSMKMLLAGMLIIVLACSGCKKAPASAVHTQAQNSENTNQSKSGVDSAEQRRGSSEANAPARPTHKHIAFSERQGERLSMVEWQIRRRGIRDPNVLFALQTSDTKFTITLTFTRGTVGEDDCILTFTNSRMLEPEEGGSNTIMLTVPVEMEGTPTAEVNDAIADCTA